jgi:hypothetical protein
MTAICHCVVAESNPVAIPNVEIVANGDCFTSFAKTSYVEFIILTFKLSQPLNLLVYSLLNILFKLLFDTLIYFLILFLTGFVLSSNHCLGISTDINVVLYDLLNVKHNDLLEDIITLIIKLLLTSKLNTPRHTGMLIHFTHYALYDKQLEQKFC